MIQLKGKKMAVIKNSINTNFEYFTSLYLRDKDINIIINDLYKKVKNYSMQTIPFDIEKIIKIHGITIINDGEIDNDISGYIEKRVNNWIIGINKYHSPRRQRFTLAHEFAHYLFDKELLEKEGIHYDTILFRGTSNNEIEKRANEFAARIMMPENIFKGYINQGIKNIPKLADIFNVSLAAIKFRGYNLGFKSTN